MKLQDQVCTLEQAKRLKELGVTAEGYFCWGEKSKQLTEGWSIEGDEDTFYSAFTVAELGLMMGTEVYTDRTGTPISAYVQWDWNSTDECCGPFATEAEARADFVIHEIETGVITAEEVNKRLE